MMRLAGRGVQPSSISAYALRLQAAILLCWPSAQPWMSSAAVKRAQLHISKHYVARPQQRVALTVQMLVKADQIGAFNRSSETERAFRALLWSGVSSLARQGELSVSGERSMAARLKVADLSPSWPWKVLPNQVTIRLARSKMKSGGDELHIVHSTAIRAIMSMLQQRRDGGACYAPLFADEAGRPITRSDLAKRSQQLARQLGYLCESSARVSMRAGGAVSLALGGASETVIRSSGRWKSDTFLRYLEPGRRVLAAGAWRCGSSVGRCTSVGSRVPCGPLFKPSCPRPGSSSSGAWGRGLT
jgi:hypothetical protein